MLPYSLCGSVQSALSGMLVARTGSYRLVMWGAWVVMTIGWGLMIMLDSTSSMWVQPPLTHIAPCVSILQCCAGNISSHCSSWDWLPVPGMSHVSHFAVMLESSLIGAAHWTPSCHASEGCGYEHRGIYLLAVRDDIPISKIPDSHILQYTGWYNRYHSRRSHHLEHSPTKTQWHRGSYYQHFRRFNQQ